MTTHDLPSISLQDFIRTLNVMSDSHEPETMDHSRRCRDISMALGAELGIRGTELVFLGYGADIHDIGKIGIPTQIIYKPGALTISEKAALHKHPEIGHEYLRYAKVPKVIQDCVLYHQEHWDGTGYPFQLTGNDIPIHARIICIADVWDALLSKRFYRPSYSFSESLQIMNKHITWFDPELYALWIKIVHREGGW